MKITFEPSICKPGQDGSAPAYSGSVTLRAPSYDERASFVEAVDFPAIAEGEEESKEAQLAQARKYNFAMTRHVAKRAPEFVEKIEIKRLSDGFVFETFESMVYDSDMASVITEIAQRLFGKNLVGGNGPTPS